MVDIWPAPLSPTLRQRNGRSPTTSPRDSPILAFQQPMMDADSQDTAVSFSTLLYSPSKWTLADDLERFSPRPRAARPTSPVAPTIRISPPAESTASSRTWISAATTWKSREAQVEEQRQISPVESPYLWNQLTPKLSDSSDSRTCSESEFSRRSSLLSSEQTSRRHAPGSERSEKSRWSDRSARSEARDEDIWSESFRSKRSGWVTPPYSEISHHHHSVHSMAVDEKEEWLEYSDEEEEAQLPELRSAPMPTRRKDRWPKAKWALLLSVTTIFGYGLAGLCIAIGIWTKTWKAAVIVNINDLDVATMLTLAAVASIVVSVVGLTGTLLNSRPILTFYNICLWPTLSAIVSIGYISYHRTHRNLDLKLNQAWSQKMTDTDRLQIQRVLHCCGYYTPEHDATFSRTCYPRSSLPGCKSSLLAFELHFLQVSYRAIFAITLLHVGAIIIAILCSNHVTNTFGKGWTPVEYRRRAFEHLFPRSEVASPVHANRRSRRTSSSRDSDARSLRSMPNDQLGTHGLGLVAEHQERKWSEHR